MVELRKRKTPPPAPEKSAKKKPGPKTKAEKAAEAAKNESAGDDAAAAAPSTAGAGDAEEVGGNEVEADAQKAANEEAKNGKAAGGDAPTVGATIDLSDFGGEVQTQEGKAVTLKQLVDESEAGVVLFTYPKASTPGCTVQACAFRDGHSTLTSTGLSIYGLSADSPKANTTFKTKQSLPYTLLCNPSYSLIAAIGMQLKPNEKKTKRGVFAVDKSGKVLLAEPGGPKPTVDAVKRLVDSLGGKSGLVRQASKEEEAEAETAGDVADTAAKLDG